MRPRIRGYYCIALWPCLCHYVPAFASTNLSCLVRGAHWCEQLAKSHYAVGNRTHNPLAIADGKQCLWIRLKQPEFFSTVSPVPSKFGERAFSHAGPATWNALPDHICTEPDPVNFRKLLKSHYFCQAFNICWFLCFFPSVSAFGWLL